MAEQEPATSSSQAQNTPALPDVQLPEPADWLHSNERLCHITIDRSELQAPMQLREEVTATFPELRELMESITLENLKEDDVILVEGLQPHCVIGQGASQDSEGVMCLSPTSNSSSSSVFCSLSKYTLGFQHAIQVATGKCSAENRDQIPERSQEFSGFQVSLSDVTAPHSIADDPPHEAITLTSNWSSHQEMPDVKELSDPMHSATHGPTEDLSSSTMTTFMDVRSSSDLSCHGGSQLMVTIDDYADWMSTEILGAVPEEVHMGQSEAQAPSGDDSASEMNCSGPITCCHSVQMAEVVGATELPSQRDVKTYNEMQSVCDLKAGEGEERDAHLSPGGLPITDIDSLANAIVQGAFQGVWIRTLDISSDHLSQAKVTTSVEVVPAVEDYLLRLTQEVISESTKEASMLVLGNPPQLVENKMKHPCIADDVKPWSEIDYGQHRRRTSDLFDDPAVLLSQCQTPQRVVDPDQIAGATDSSPNLAVRSMAGDLEVESPTKTLYNYLGGTFSENLETWDKEMVEARETEKLIFDKLGLTKKWSLDCPDAPPSSPLKPQLVGNRRSFTRKLKGGLAKEFLPSPPPSTPKEHLDLSWSEEDTEAEEAEFVRKLIRSLSQEVDGKGTGDSVEHPEINTINLEQKSPAVTEDSASCAWSNQSSAKDYFAHLVSDIVSSSTQIIHGIMTKTTDPAGRWATLGPEDQSHTQTSLLGALSPETDGIQEKCEGDTKEDGFQVKMEAWLWQYTARLTHGIITALINFLNQIELLEEREHHLHSESKIATAEAPRQECSHSYHIKQLSSMSDGWVRGLVQSALHVCKTRRLSRGSSFVRPSQGDRHTEDSPNLGHVHWQGMSAVQEESSLRDIDQMGSPVIGTNTEQESQQLVMKALETTECQADSLAVLSCNSYAFSEQQQQQNYICVAVEDEPNAILPDSREGEDTETIAGLQEGKTKTNGSLMNSSTDPLLNKQQHVEVKPEEVTRENLTLCVHEEAKDTSDIRSNLNEDGEEPEAIHSQTHNKGRKSSISESSSIRFPDSEDNPASRAYAESLAETILGSCLANMCRYSRGSMEEAGLVCPCPSKLCKDLESDSDSGCSVWSDQEAQTEAVVEADEGAPPAISSIKSPRLNVVEYTGLMPAERGDGLRAETSQLELGEGQGHAGALSSPPTPGNIELLLVNFNSSSAPGHAQVQAALQWAVASQLHATRICVINSSEVFAQFPALLARAEEEAWMVGSLVRAVLTYLEERGTADSSSHQTLFTWLLARPAARQHQTI